MPPLLFGYGALAAAIACEVIGTMFLQKSEQFTKLTPTLITAICYCASFYCLTHALKVMPIGIAYAIWGGLGIVITALIGVFIFRQTLDAAALAGIGLIVSGVLVINLFSHSAAHGS